MELSLRALEDSTLAIEQQCATLTSQLAAMQEIKRQNDRFSFSDRDADGYWRLKQRETEAETAEMTELLQTKAATLQRQTAGSITALKTATARQLDKDDRLFEGLQKLLLSLEAPNDQDQQIREVEDLSRALVSLQSTVIKKRANQTYSSAMAQTTSGSESFGIAELDQTLIVETETLATELDSLIEEVGSVLAMAIDHQYRHPILNTLKRRDAEARAQRQQWLSYILTNLEQMTSRLQELHSHTHDLTHYGAALAAVSATLEEMTVKRQATETARPSVPVKPQHKSVRDLALPASSTSQRNPAVDFLRHHGIHLTTASINNAETRYAIEAAVQERKARLEDLSISTQEGILGQVSEAADTADAQLQGLLDAVYAYSPFGTVHLADSDVKARLVELGKNTDVLAEQVRGFDLKGSVENERKEIEKLLCSDADA